MAPAVARDPDIWFDDGSIVLVASHSVAFRVYKRLLAHHATIFDDMFTVGRPSTEGDEMMDGVSVVHLADPPDALRIFLLVLISSGFSTPRWSHPKLPEELQFSTFDALMRIAHKYEAAHILRMLFKHIDSIALASRDGPWGDDLVCQPTAGTEVLPFAVLISDDDAVEAVNLARCVGADDAIVAAMLWQCCLRGPLFLRDGTTREAGVVSRLSDEDFVRCVEALPRLLLLRRDVVLRTFATKPVPRAPKCRRGFGCVSSDDLLAAYARNPPDIPLADPESEERNDNNWYGGVIPWDSVIDKGCLPCQEHLRQRLDSAFDTYWRQDLPKLFRL